MNRHALTTAAALFALAGCEDADHDHDHAEGTDHHAEGTDDHAEGTDHHAAAPTTTPTQPAPAASTPQPFSLGAWTAELEGTAEGLRLRAEDASGAAVSPSGQARVVLTGTGEGEQRIVLSPGEEAWTGAARAAGAKGYVAVVSIEVDGHTESARVTWGEVPEVSSAPEPADPAPDHADDHADGHDHGHDHGH